MTLYQYEINNELVWVVLLSLLLFYIITLSVGLKTVYRFKLKLDKPMDEMGWV